MQDVTLHDLDSANARPSGGQDIMSVMGQVGRGRSRVKGSGFRAHSHGRDSRLSGPQVDKTS